MNVHLSGISEMADLDEAGYQALIQERDRLELMLQRIKSAIETYEKIRVLKADLASADIASIVSPEAAANPQTRRRNELPPARLAEIAREIILEAGKPQTRSEIAAAMKERGITLVGRDPAKNIGTILWRYRAEFENIPDQGYWPKDVPPRENG